MEWAKAFVACLVLLLASAASSDARDAGSIDDEKRVGDDVAKAIISERLGIRVTVAEANQINIRPPHDRQFRGGLCVVLLTGPLAQVANLRVGDVIVKIDDAEVTDVGSAIRALRRADESAGKTRLTIVRGGRVKLTEIMVGPSIHQRHNETSTAEFASRNTGPSLQQYLAKSELLAEEQQELERLAKANVIDVPRIRQLTVSLEMAKQQLPALKAMIEDPPAGVVRGDLVAHRQAMEEQIELIEKELSSLNPERTAEQIQTHRVRLRVLEHSLDKTIKELRLAGKHREQN